MDPTILHLFESIDKNSFAIIYHADHISNSTLTKFFSYRRIINFFYLINFIILDRFTEKPQKNSKNSNNLDLISLSIKLERLDNEDKKNSIIKGI